MKCITEYNVLTRRCVLSTEDRSFQCIDESALEAAYLLNTAEAAFNRNPSDRYELADILRRYCEGALSAEEAIAQLNEDLTNADESVPSETG